MTARPHPIAWVPPLAVGAAAAVAGELSVALLLYTTTGFLSALTVILVVELAALGLGLWSAPDDGGPAWESVRRRWLLSLVAFTAAAGVAAGWGLAGGLASQALLRGIGLAFLAAIPLYACGTVLGVMAAVRRSDSLPSPVGAPAVLGAAAGAAAVGLGGARIPPVSAYLVCVAGLSAASVVHGRLLDRRVRRRVLETAVSAAGPVRLEERVGGGRRELAVLAGGVVRAARAGGASTRPWEGAARSLLLEAGPPGRVLVVGAGAAGLAGSLGEGARATVAEPDPAVADLVARHLEGFVGPEGEGIVPCDLADGVIPAGPWDAVVVDASALPGTGPVPRPPRTALGALARATEPAGLLLLGGVDLDAGTGPDGARPGLDALEVAARAVGLEGLMAWSAPQGGGVVALLHAPRPLPDPPGWRRVRVTP